MPELFNRQELFLILPPAILAVTGLVILLFDFLFRADEKRYCALLALAGVTYSGYTLWNQYLALRNSRVGLLGFAGSVVVDSFSVFFSALFLAAAALVILLSMKYLDTENEHHGEYYALMLFAAVGMMFMASGTDLIVLFIGLETMALSFYVMAGFLRGDRRSNEGALKYLLLGAFSSGVLAYGFSILYGLSGSTKLGYIAAALEGRVNAPAASLPHADLLALVAVITVSVGMFFKVAAVPFHQWAPDVYEGAPTSITAYVSVASSAASFAMLLRIFLTAFQPVRADWELLVIIVSLATMTVGNLAAITQSNVKRMLAYSSISHAGYVLLGLVAGNDTGIQAIAFYLLAYTFMNVGAFAIIILMRRQGVIGDELEDLNGLSHRNPAAAWLMLLFLLSLAGIPPTAGFVGKYFIFLALIQAKQYLLAVIGVLYILPAVYYYLRIAQHMFLREVTDPAEPRMSPGQAVAIAACAVVTVAACILANPFVKLAAWSVLTPFGR